MTTKPAHKIVEEVCAKHGVEPTLVRSRLSRSRRLSPARWEIAQRLHAERGMKFARIAEWIGGMDERAVAYMVNPELRAAKRARHLATYVRKAPQKRDDFGKFAAAVAAAHAQEA